MNLTIKLLIILAVVILLFYLIWRFWLTRRGKNEKFTKIENDSSQDQELGYKGIVLFDIDGTLTTGTENFKVVQYFIDNNYAVGVTTAGSIYNKENLSSWEWMPSNLYTFIANNQFISFNNVGSSVLCGEYNPTIFEKHKFSLPNMEGKQGMGYQIGWAKGLTLLETGLKFGITNYKKMILIDNDPQFLEGAELFNNEFVLIPGGLPASMETMSLKNIMTYF